MDSQILLATRLLDEGKKFTFASFCLPHPSKQPYGGDATPEWLAWISRVTNLIYALFAETSPVQKVLHEGLKIGTEGNPPEHFTKKQAYMLRALEMAIEVMKDDSFGELRASSPAPANPALSNRVFVVHGHDHALKTDLEALLHQFGLQPVVLHREADQGRTLIEKFEAHSDVGYAFILLTPDDVGYIRDQDRVADDSRTKEFRARQNVIFEFGFFIGRLGRERVCCLYKRGVTIPTDLAGLVYKEVDGSIETQAFGIIKELKAAGYSIKF